MFSWDAVTAVSSAVSAIVIVATVAVGYRQIRLAGDQLSHLRSATQLDGTMKVFAELESPRFRAARLFVETELEQCMRDATFRDEVRAWYHSLNENQHKEILITDLFEKIGTYARHELLDSVLIADYCGPVIRAMWTKLESSGYLELRRTNNPYILENFEFLYDAAMQWYENEDPPFRSKRRKQLTDPSPEQSEPTQA